MRLLDRYLLRELLIPLVYCLSGFVIFYSAFDLIVNLHKYQEYQMTFGDCLQYYLITMPEVLVLLIPVAFLLSLLYALTNHARNNEITAMRAAGISLWRLCLPHFAVGIVLTASVFSINEQWAPQARQRAKQLCDRHLVTTEKKTALVKLQFLNESAHRFWDVRRYNPVTSEMVEANIFCDLPGGSSRILHAQSGVYSNGVWHFFGVQEEMHKAWNDLNPQLSDKAESVETTFTETPELIRSEMRVAALYADPLQAGKRAQLPIAEVRDYMRLHPGATDARRTMLMTQLYGRFAEPCACLMVTLIAIPLGARSGRRNVFVGVAGSIFICFAYFILQKICLSMGVGGYLPPLLAAWLPNLAFGITGIALINKAR